MSSVPPLARLATRALAETEEAPVRPSPEADARAIEAIARAIDARRRAELRRRWGIGGAATLCLAGLAAAALVRVGSADAPPITARTHALAGTVVVVRGGQAAPVEGGADVVAGDRLVAPATGRASLNLSTGTHVVLESGGEVQVSELGASQRFLVRSGAFRADVAKLGPGQRFVVATPDAEVEVRGTSFRVSVVPPSPSCGGGTMTRVSVLEGVVVVRSRGEEQRVPAGRDWPDGCSNRDTPPIASPSIAVDSPPSVWTAPTSPTAPSGDVVTSRPTPSVAVQTPPRASPAPSAPAERPEASDLAEQNRLFAEASSARRRGASSEAIARYDAFLARYPSSQLAESAMVERMRLLGASNPTAGAAAAREYLRRYPAGFARQEALGLAAAQP